MEKFSRKKSGVTAPTRREEKLERQTQIAAFYRSHRAHKQSLEKLSGCFAKRRWQRVRVNTLD